MDTPTGNYSNHTVPYASGYLTELKPNRVMTQLHRGYRAQPQLVDDGHVTFKLNL